MPPRQGRETAFECKRPFPDSQAEYSTWEEASLEDGVQEQGPPGSLRHIPRGSYWVCELLLGELGKLVSRASQSWIPDPCKQGSEQVLSLVTVPLSQSRSPSCCRQPLGTVATGASQAASPSHLQPTHPGLWGATDGLCWLGDPARWSPSSSSSQGIQEPPGALHSRQPPTRARHSSALSPVDSPDGGPIRNKDSAGGQSPTF